MSVDVSGVVAFVDQGFYGDFFIVSHFAFVVHSNQFRGLSSEHTAVNEYKFPHRFCFVFIKFTPIMEQQGKPISELLNSVAIIQQEMQNCQDPAKELELLGELKLLAARIYIETDFAMLSMGELAEEIHELDLDTDEEIETEIEETEDEVREFVADDASADVQEDDTDEILPVGELLEQPVPDLFSMGSFVPEPVMFQPNESTELTAIEAHQNNTSLVVESHDSEIDTGVRLESVLEEIIEPQQSDNLSVYEVPVVLNETAEAEIQPMEELIEAVMPISPVEETPVFAAETSIPVIEARIPVMEQPAGMMENGFLNEAIVDVDIPVVAPPVIEVEQAKVVVETPPVDMAPPVNPIEPPIGEIPPIAGEIPPPALPGMNVEAIINQMPISRRFEFANLLFGGDVQRMGTFIHELLQSPSGSTRMDIYERWYEENNWRRRDEAASDLLRLIKRIFPA